MVTTAIMACDNKHGIAKDGKIPWHIPADFKLFMQYTKNTWCIIGRNSYQEIVQMRLNRATSPFTSALNDRRCIVVTSDPLLKVCDEDLVAASVAQAFDICTSNTQYSDISILGGSSIYVESIPYIDKVIITHIDRDYHCDKLVPLNSLLQQFPNTVMLGVLEHDGLTCSVHQYTRRVTT